MDASNVSPSVGDFKYQESSTFDVVPCNHPLCVPRICENNLCVYDIRYAGGSHTTGYLSTDTFKFPTHESGDVS